MYNISAHSGIYPQTPYPTFFFFTGEDAEANPASNFSPNADISLSNLSVVICRLGK